ncbi:amino acid adenylation domain-containing protein/thioester reductase domain-containing protein [Dyella sp. OK004]|uniref:amino acid adenylation domain-containing protein n=1 Tax=Dyella sp. OK004 TaxID=1855292 RepID=UPI0008EE7C36|nr:amino acid adenylation domain-containing protein [Dyella sp. OK004]SFS18384.1 amino acid adenylation domain-containing protein/thioester reductase domain-containing protein [Dyella sp. OK004]
MGATTSTVLDHFHGQANQHARALAVIDRQTTLTYEELDRQSDAVAAYLIEKGIQPGDLVPLLADRSAALIVGLLGIAKAGAAYVPIDMSYPAQRKQFIVAQTGASLALTTSRTAYVADDCECASIHELVTAPASPISIRPSPQQIAYVIFTSGTTGVPKGVVIEHQSLENIVAWHNREFSVTPDSRLTLMAKIGFDVSQWEIWSALCAGAPLYLLDEETRIDTSALVAFYGRNGITHAFVPTVMVADVVAVTSRVQTALQYLFTAGEKLSPVDTDCITYALIDYYGPTEATIFATVHRVVSATCKSPSSIGVPVAGADVVILDDALADVAVGEVGELCIAGPGLARGYLNDEALTNKKFVTRDKTRLYRSGDLARFLPDGSLQFLGRRDEQIKIRGNRVELGEIEAQLLLLPQIKKASVIVTTPDDPARKEIAAFLVVNDDQVPVDGLVVSIKNALKAMLPDYMLPAHYLFVSAIPLTANGKIDKQALLQLHAEKLVDTPAEAVVYHGRQLMLAGIFRELLGHGDFGPDDSFFDIGGHSLLAAELIAAISDKLGVKAYIRDIYEYPSIATLTAELERREGAAAPVIDGEPIRALLDDVYLPADVSFKQGFHTGQITTPRQILLTGVTGFVGIHLLQELLGTTDATIHCPIRSHDQEHAHARLVESLSKYDVRLDQADVGRVRVYAADLAEPEFGLASHDYRYLCNTVDIIYHSASAVNFIQPYSYMRKDNVQGLREIVGFAATGKLKPLALLSTISVYSWGHLHTHKRVMREDDDIDQNLPAVITDIGYVRSKWVMEKIADLAANHGLPLMTFRLGYATFHSKTGVCASYQWWSRLVKTCIANGTVPDLHDLREGLTTVDYMVRAIAHISRNPEALGKKFNLIHSDSNNLTLLTFFKKLESHFGFHFKAIPYADWRGQWEHDAGAPLYPLLSLFKDVMCDGQSTVELYQNTYQWDCSNVTEFLQGSGIAEPTFDREALQRYLERSIGLTVA